jgi:hypothetical protein
MPKRKTNTMKPVKSKTMNLSLDKRYTKELNELYNKQYSIKDKKKEITSIQKKIDQMKGDPVKIIECNNLGLRQTELKKEITKIESGENMTDFLLDTCHIIKEFLELDEKEKTLYNHEKNQENNQSQLDEKDEILSNIHLEKSRLSKRYSSVIDYTIAPIEQDYIHHRRTAL